MKVNKNSWHYKLWRKYGGDEFLGSVSLCGYVQRLFWVSLFVAALATVMAICVGTIVAGLVSATIHHPVVVGCAALGMALLFGAVYVSTMRPPWSDFLFRKHTIKGPPGLVASWVKAKKDKVCPLLDFED